MDLKEEKILGKEITTHWYYVAKGNALRSFIGDIRVDEILDVGAGSGVFSRRLLDDKICNRAVCIDPGYKEERTEIYNNSEINFVRYVNNISQRLILMMDVLEHVDDDIGMLREYSERMPKGGLVLITVPAFQFIWSGHDIFLEHRRRYTKKSIESTVESAKLQIVRCRYFFGLLFPIVAAIRLLNRAMLRARPVKARSSLKKYPFPINALLTFIHKVECAILFPFNYFGGLSIFLLARRL